MIIIEVLSWNTAITGFAVTVVWTIVLLIWLVAGLRTRYLAIGLNSIRKVEMPASRSVRFVVGVMALIGAILLFLAWISASNNVDSLLYHMPRVAYWTQNRSLQHYAANYHHQLSMPIWAATAILQIRLLAGGDDLSNLVQWASMAGSVIGVSAIVALMRGSTWTQLVAAAYTISIPMGVLQATSTQNDYAVSLWMVCLGYFIVISVSHKDQRLEWAYVGLALGLGLLTKATAYIYALPFVVWYFAATMRNVGATRALKVAVLVATTAGLLNLGYWSRNLATYGTPFGPSEIVRRTLAFLPDVSSSEKIERPVELVSVGNNLVTNTATALARNLMTPHTGLNRALVSGLSQIPGVVQPAYEEEMAHAIWNFEDTAGNPLHLLAVPASIVLLLVATRRLLLEGRMWIWLYLACAAAGFFLLVNLISNGASVVGLRFQLTFFVLWAPLVGLSMIVFRSKRISMLIAGAFLLASIPWVLLNNTRPLATYDKWTTRIGSVLTASQSEVMFAMAPHLRDQYVEMASIVTSSGCQEVGYRIDSSDPGYLIWWVLGAPESGIRMEPIFTYPELEKYLVADFSPCVVICTICDGMESFIGLPLAGQYADARLYMD